MNKIYFLIALIFLSLNFEAKGDENRILFKIKNKVFTSIDLENRKKYTQFIGNNQSLNEEVIKKDYISANIFNEYFINSNRNNIDLDQNVLQVFDNINNENEKNKRIFDFVIKKEIILKNLKIDLIRKTILEDLINSEKDRIVISKSDRDLLYKYEIEYINIKHNNISKIKSVIEEFKINKISDIIKILEIDKENYFIQKKEINNLNSINSKIKDNILANEFFFILNEKHNKITIVEIKKSFETYEGLIVNLFSYESKEILNKEFLECKNLNNFNNQSLIKKEYEYSKLNNEIKNKLLEINDYIKFENNNKYIYVILCDIKFNKNILNNFDINKSINSYVEILESKFINKYSKIYNLQILDE